MAKRADLSSKRLISLAPDAWVRWVTGNAMLTAQELLDGEFQWLGRDSDALVKVRHPDQGELIVLTEIQLRYQKRMPQRMRAYAGLAEEKYGLPVYPVLVNLLKPSDRQDVPSAYESQVLGLRSLQEYRVINLWQLPVEPVFDQQLTPLLPFSPLMEGGATEDCLRRAAACLRADEALQELESVLALFASFVLELSIVERILRWDMAMLKDSPLAQELIRQGEQRGRQVELSRVLDRLLTRCCGPLPEGLRCRIDTLPAERQEDLIDAVLDFTSPRDLENWLGQ